MSAQPCAASYAVHYYLAMQEEAEGARERLNRQVSDELAKRDTWVEGLNDLAYQLSLKPSPVIDALIAGDDAQFGFLVRQHITERYAVEQAESAIQIQDEDWANGL